MIWFFDISFYILSITKLWEQKVDNILNGIKWISKGGY